MSINWFKYSSPQTFFPLAGKLAIGFGVLALLGVGGSDEKSEVQTDAAREQREHTEAERELSR